LTENQSGQPRGHPASCSFVALGFRHGTHLPVVEGNVAYDVVEGVVAVVVGGGAGGHVAVAGCVEYAQFMVVEPDKVLVSNGAAVPPQLQ
jgi:hypothetical protein